MKKKYLAIVFNQEQKKALFDVLICCYTEIDGYKETKNTTRFIFHLANDNTRMNFKVKYNTLPTRLRFKVIELKK